MSWKFWETKPRPSGPKPVKPYWLQSIQRDALELILESAKSQHPNEFGALLRAQKGVVTEVVVLPGTVSGATHAIFQLNMLPIDFTIKGTVHSHPTPNPRPSGADLELFARFGTTHIIVAHPYTDRSWRAYNARGEPISLEVVE